MPDEKAIKRPWWRLHVSSYVVASIVLAATLALNLGSADIDRKPCFGWPFIYLSLDTWIESDPFGEDPFGADPPQPLWLWQCSPEHVKSWVYTSLWVDASVLLFGLAATVGSWEWRRRHRRSLWQVTLLDLMALTTIVSVLIFGVQNLYRDNRGLNALVALGVEGEPSERTPSMTRSCVSNVECDRPLFGLFYMLGVKIENQPRTVTGLHFSDSLMTNEAFVEACQLLENFRGLHRLHVNLSQVRDVDWKRCHGLDRSQSLTLMRSASDDELSRLPAWPVLKELNIGVYQASEAGVGKLAKLRNLEELKLRGVNTGTVRGLRNFENAVFLRSLIISGNRLSAEDLATIGKLHRLERLTLDGPTMKYGTRPSGTPGIDVSTTRPASPVPLPLSLLGSMPNLGTIRVSNYNIDAEGTRALAKMPKLDEIEIMECDLKAEDLAPLKKCPQLNSLTVECHDLHGESVHVVTDIVRLRKLHLLSAYLSDDDLQKISQLKNIERLELEAENITDAGLSHLCELPWLFHLGIDCRLNSSPALQKLKNTNPELSVRLF